MYQSVSGGLSFITHRKDARLKPKNVDKFKVKVSVAKEFYE